MGFEPQIRQVLASGLPSQHEGRQTAMFSATFPDTIRQLASEFQVGAPCEMMGGRPLDRPSRPIHPRVHIRRTKPSGGVCEMFTFGLAVPALVL
eukprot:1179841-Prorocentrum_minimum.AAC.1